MALASTPFWYKRRSHAGLEQLDNPQFWMDAYECHRHQRFRPNLWRGARIPAGQAHAFLLTPLASTTTTVSAFPSPSLFGQSVTFTATVTPNEGDVRTMAVRLQFAVDGNNFGSPQSLSVGQCEYPGFLAERGGTHGHRNLQW